MNNIIERTIYDFCSILNSKKILYAVMRNYETLPKVGHDLDIICNKDDLIAIEKILIQLSEKYGWDYLVKDIHWESKIYCFNIISYKLFLINSTKYLQIDIFGGFPISGICSLDSQALLGSREFYKFFYKIDIYDEFIIRIMQLGKAIISNDKKRIKKILKILEQYEFEKIKNHFKKRLYLSLFVNDFRDCKFVIKYRFFKLKYLLYNLFSHPYKIFYCIFFRVVDYLKLYLLKQPGLTIYINPLYEKQTLAILKKLKEENFITHYLIVKDNKIKFIFKILKTKERGGIVICYKKNSTFKVTFENFIKMLIYHNEIIYEKKN